MSQWKLPLALFLITGSQLAIAHGGGLDASGCHTNKKTGEYHCHKASQKTDSKPVMSLLDTKSQDTPSKIKSVAPTTQALPSGCHVGPRGGTYTITKSGKKNYGGC